MKSKYLTIQVGFCKSGRVIELCLIQKLILGHILQLTSAGTHQDIFEGLAIYEYLAMRFFKRQEMQYYDRCMEHIKIIKLKAPDNAMETIATQLGLKINSAKFIAYGKSLALRIFAD